MILSRSRVKVKVSYNGIKNETIGHIFDVILPTDFIISIITAFCDSFGCCPLVFPLFCRVCKLWKSQGEIILRRRRKIFWNAFQAPNKSKSGKTGALQKELVEFIRVS